MEGGREREKKFSGRSYEAVAGERGGKRRAVADGLEFWRILENVTANRGRGERVT